MYGYRLTKYLGKVRIRTFLTPVIIMVVYLVLDKMHIVALSADSKATILVALVAITVTIDNVYSQASLALRHKLESKANSEINEALYEFQGVASISVVFDSSFEVKPITITPGFWWEKASNKHTFILEEAAKMRRAYGKIYTSIESNEIAVIHLEQYYRYITLLLDKFFEKIDRSSTEFMNATSSWALTQVEYVEAVKIFSPLRDDWSDIAVYFMDFRKMLQNDLLGQVFKRQLRKRRPKQGFGNTLDKVATFERVSKLVNERDREFSDVAPVDSNSI